MMHPQTQQNSTPRPKASKAMFPALFKPKQFLFCATMALDTPRQPNADSAMQNRPKKNWKKSTRDNHCFGKASLSPNQRLWLCLCLGFSQPWGMQKPNVQSPWICRHAVFALTLTSAFPSLLFRWPPPLGSANHTRAVRANQGLRNSSSSE